MSNVLSAIPETAVLLPAPASGIGARHEQSLRRLLIWVALYALPARAVFQPVIDPDIWWHLRTGQWIVEHQSVPATDPFSSFGQGKPWLAYSWLYDLVVYGLYSGLGLGGLVLYRAVLIFAVVVAVHRLLARLQPQFVWATGLTALTLTAFIPLWNERPWLLTILFSTCTLTVVLDLRQGSGTRTAWLLPLIYVLWANFHIQFVYGLLILALACAAPVLDRFMGWINGNRKADTLGKGAWRRLVLLAALCATATLLNPYHVRLYGVVLQYATQPVADSLIEELNPMPFQHAWDWIVLALFGLAAFTLGRRKQTSAFDVLLLAGSASLAFRAQRDLWFLVLASTTILAERHSRADATDEPFPVTPLRAFSAVGAALMLVAWLSWLRGNLAPARFQDQVARRYPEAAAAFIASKHFQGPLFNSFNWGGYLIWKIPNLPVALDGRTNLHGDERIQRLVNTWRGRPGWKTDPELAAAQLVLAPLQEPLASLLDRDPQFRKVYQDKVAVVFLRSAQPQD